MWQHDKRKDLSIFNAMRKLNAFSLLFTLNKMLKLSICKNINAHCRWSDADHNCDPPPAPHYIDAANCGILNIYKQKKVNMIHLIQLEIYA